MTTITALEGLAASVDALQAQSPLGRVTGAAAGVIHVAGLCDHLRIGDRLSFQRRGLPSLGGEVVQIRDGQITALPEAAPKGIALGDRVVPAPADDIAVCAAWIGRIIDPTGTPLDGRPLPRGPQTRPLRRAPPPPAQRRPLGARLATGWAVTNTLLPIVTGQRIGLFAGSGVGKSSLLGSLAVGMQADIVVIALIGERGRELRAFVDEVLGAQGLTRSVVIAATSDQSALERRRCAWTAMTVAEHFRDQGKSVLLLADSITRFAEAHREVAVAAGEAPVLRGYPPSTAPMIMALCERAGPGVAGQGDITALFSVLVAGSDMDEPIADILRGVLDGHIVLDREIAERGRYPAIDVLRSVSRSLPAAASEKENALLAEARKLLGIYEQNAVMIRAGLYTPGIDAELDVAVALWPELDDFLALPAPLDPEQSFQKLELILRRARSAAPAGRPASKPQV